MKSIVAAFGLCLFFTMGVLAMSPQKYRDGFPLLGAVERCELVVIGTVSGMEYVNRLDSLTTDVSVTVEKVIRGRPNIDDSTVKFMIQGGVDARQDRRLIVSGVPTFEMGERVLLFLNDGTTDKYYKRYPHGSYHLHRRPYGKREIKDGTVDILYPNREGKFRLFKMPVDLAVDLGKAFLINKTAAKRIEQTIKDMAIMSSEKEVILLDSTIESLQREAKQIIDSEEE